MGAPRLNRSAHTMLTRCLPSSVLCTILSVMFKTLRKVRMLSVPAARTLTQYDEIPEKLRQKTPNLYKYCVENPFYTSYTNLFQRHLYRLAVRARPATILEVGCGEGFLSAYLKSRMPGMRLHGLDINENAIGFARDHFGHLAQFSTGSIYELPFGAGSFDLVLCSQVLEHLEDPEAAVAELKRVSSAHLLISVPAEPMFRLLSGVFTGLGLGPDPEHVRFWNPLQFRRWMKRELVHPRISHFFWHQAALGRVVKRAGVA